VTSLPLCIHGDQRGDGDRLHRNKARGGGKSKSEHQASTRVLEIGPDSCHD
jgi:hypothetical protein